LLLGAALDIARLAMKAEEEGSISSDELLRMHQCTEAIQFLSAAGLIPTKQLEEKAGPLQDGPYSSLGAHSAPLLHEASEMARVSASKVPPTSVLRRQTRCLSGVVPASRLELQT
jgi:hypothetical protein